MQQFVPDHTYTFVCLKYTYIYTENKNKQRIKSSRSCIIRSRVTSHLRKKSNRLILIIHIQRVYWLNQSVLCESCCWPSLSLVATRLTLVLYRVTLQHCIWAADGSVSILTQAKQTLPPTVRLHDWSIPISRGIIFVVVTNFSANKGRTVVPILCVCVCWIYLAFTTSFRT